MRGPKGWLTPEARELFRRRQMPRQRGLGAIGTTLTGGMATELGIAPVPVGDAGLTGPSRRLGLGALGNASLAGSDDLSRGFGNVRELVESVANAIAKREIAAKFELTTNPTIRMVIGTREVDLIAEAVLQRIEKKVRLVPIPGTP